MPEDGSDPAAHKTVARTAFLLVGLCFLLNALSRGVGETFTTFLLSLTEEFQAERADVAAIYSLQMLLLGCAAPLAGYCFDRFGPLRLYLGGLLLLIGGLTLASFASQLWQLYLFIGCGIGAAGSALGNVPHSALLARWFEAAKLSRAMSVVYAALGIGALLLVPLAQLVIETWGWRAAYLILAGIGVLILPALLLLPWRQVQAGRIALPPQLSDQAAATSAGLPGKDWTLLSAIRTSAFWGLASVFFFTGGGMFSVMVQAVAYLVEQGFAPLQAASIYGFVGVLTPIGIIGFAWADGRIGRHASAALSYAFSLAGLGALWALSVYQSMVLVALFVVLVGLSFGARGPMVGATAARIFQGRRFGSIFGMVMVGSGLGVAAGTFIGAKLHDVTGGYAAVFLFSGFCIILGALPFWTYRSLRRYSA